MVSKQFINLSLTILLLGFLYNCYKEMKCLCSFYTNASHTNDNNKKMLEINFNNNNQV